MAESWLLEEVNELLGSRRVLSASPYSDQEAALQRAAELASSRRQFYVCNVLGHRGQVIAAFRGAK